MSNSTETDTIHFKNAKTGEHQSITRYDLNMVAWGFTFLVGTEQEAYRAAYEFRDFCGTLVEYSVPTSMWQVTVLNEFGKKIGIGK